MAFHNLQVWERLFRSLGRDICVQRNVSCLLFSGTLVAGPIL